MSKEVTVPGTFYGRDEDGELVEKEYDSYFHCTVCGTEGSKEDTEPGPRLGTRKCPNCGSLSIFP